jgi:hypothetical protein
LIFRRRKVYSINVGKFMPQTEKQMPVPSRLEFLARHFGDLQTIRFAPVPAAMILAPAAHRMTHLSRSVAWAMLLGALVLAVGVYRWSTLAIRRRYGSVRLSREEALRMTRHPIIVGLNVLAAALMCFYFFARHSYYWDLYIALTILTILLRTILDSTNLAGRRLAWAAGLVVLFTAGPFLLSVNGGAIALAGAVWLSLSIFDFLLLRRIFAESSAAPTAATEAEMHRG